MPEHPPAGDAEAFAEVYDRLSAPIYRYLVHLIGRGGDADDLFQETWAKVLEHREQLRDPRLFTVWIFRIARNLAFNEMRKGRRKAQVWILSNLASPEGEDGESLIDQMPHPGPTPLTETINGQRRELIRGAIAQLDVASQEMLQLRFFEGFSLPEIAGIMDAPLGTVCSKIHRSLKLVQERLKERGVRAREEI